jgi:SAM-dependent MidA family methyltransferase
MRDITAHVDFTTLARALEQGDLVTHGLVRQSEFLLGAGLEELFTARRDDPATELGDYLELRSSVVRLLDPRALGGFRVLVASRGAPTEPPLRGLARARVERP